MGIQSLVTDTLVVRLWWMHNWSCSRLRRVCQHAVHVLPEERCADQLRSHRSGSASWRRHRCRVGVVPVWREGVHGCHGVPRLRDVRVDACGPRGLATHGAVRSCCGGAKGSTGGGSGRYVLHDFATVLVLVLVLVLVTPMLMLSTALPVAVADCVLLRQSIHACARWCQRRRLVPCVCCANVSAVSRKKDPVYRDRTQPLRRCHAAALRLRSQRDVCVPQSAHHLPGASS